MQDADIVQRIRELTEQEHALERGHVGQGLSADELEQMRAAEVALDQCWDLLRQRRARRNAGQDPDAATARSEGVVENYEQ
jgi:Protein of unknown function (DUF2630)